MSEQRQRLLSMHTRSGLTSVYSFIAILGIVVGTLSCQARPEGYWTRLDRSQALTNQEYPADAEKCQAFVGSDSVEKSQAYKQKLFTQCMQAKGYQWVDEPRGRQTLNADARRFSLSPEDCSKGRLTVDAFGYQKCVPRGSKDGRVVEEPPPRIPTMAPSARNPNPPVVEETRQPVDGRAKDDDLCRQYAKESMSNTYGVYSQCMRDKGWLSPKP